MPPKLRNNCAEPVYNISGDDKEDITLMRDTDNRRQSGREKDLAKRGNSLLIQRKPADNKTTAGEKCALAQEK